MINKGIVNFISLKGFRVQQRAADCLYNIRVYLYKEVYKNFIGVLGFGYFSIINIAHLGGLWRWEKTEDYFKTVIGCGVWTRHTRLQLFWGGDNWDIGNQ